MRKVDKQNKSEIEHQFLESEKNRLQREQLLMDKFYEIHPKKSLPLWFDSYVQFSFFHDYKRKYIEYSNTVMTVFLNKVLVLEESEFWGEINGLMAPVHIDPKTGEKIISIHWSNDEHVLFQACLNVTNDIEILLDTEIDGLIQEQYVKKYE